MLLSLGKLKKRFNQFITDYEKMLAEGVGTMFLVLLACGSAVLAGPSIGGLGIGLCFGLVLVCLCYCLGNISGCHVNPSSFVGCISCRSYER